MPQHVWQTLKWVNSLTASQKRGLRLVKTICDVKGRKKFKIIDKES